MKQDSIAGRLAGLLKRYPKAYIQTHDFPDPDALGAAFALQELLGRHGVDAGIIFNGKVDKLGVRKMSNLIGIELLDYAAHKPRMSEDDAVVLVDCQKCGGNVLDVTGDEIACIDHHPACAGMSQYAIAYHRVTGSCCTLISELYQEDGEIPSPGAAAALLFGLKSDTADFSRGVTVQDVSAYGYLFQYADKDIMAELEKNAIEFSDLKAYGAAIKSVQVYGRAGFAGLDFPCPDALIALVADFLLDIEEIDVAVVWSWREGGAKFSVRSEDDRIDAGVLARNALSDLGNGGGHAGMAGGFAAVPECDKSRFENFVRSRFLAEIENAKGD